MFERSHFGGGGRAVRAERAAVARGGQRISRADRPHVLVLLGCVRRKEIAAIGQGRCRCEAVGQSERHAIANAINIANDNGIANDNDNRIANDDDNVHVDVNVNDDDDVNVNDLAVARGERPRVHVPRDVADPGRENQLGHVLPRPGAESVGDGPRVHAGVL